MLAYHVDTARQLSPGMLLTLRSDWREMHGLSFLLRTLIRQQFPKGVSAFGARVLQKPDSLSQTNQQFFELILEQVRLQSFVSLPSRFASVFAVPTPAQAPAWRQRIAEDAEACPVFAVETEAPCFSFDAALLDCAKFQPDKPIDYPAALFPVARRYWRSAVRFSEAQSSETSSTVHTGAFPPRKPELLLPLPVRVLEQVGWA